MVKSMKPGSVIVDLAVETGGNCELSEPGKVVAKHGVKIIGHFNVPSRLAADSSRLYARNILNFLQLIIDKESGSLVIDTDDEIIAGTLVARDGQVVHPALKPAAPKPAEAGPEQGEPEQGEPEESEDEAAAEGVAEEGERHGE
jgi:NAD(P) transhydrogenase subunit alpha